jgi:ABC-type Zn2+ transport system substrate-binding protein/surface adhesin
MNVVNVVKASGASAEPLSKDLHIWIDQEVIHIKAVDAHGDPVEITGETARKLAARLVEMADELGE